MRLSSATVRNERFLILYYVVYIITQYIKVRTEIAIRIYRAPRATLEMEEGRD
jgi:hypothetical protein